MMKHERITRFACVDRGNFDSKRLCSRSRNFGIFSIGMFPHFLISQRLKYVANEHTNARLQRRFFSKLILQVRLSHTLLNFSYCSNHPYMIYKTIRISIEELLQ